MAQNKKTVRLCDYFEINVYEPITNNMLATTDLMYCTFEEALFKLLQLHKRFPNKDFDIFFRPDHFGGLYVENSKE